MGERIKQIRKYFGLTQLEFSKKLLLSRNHIAQVETGKGAFSDRTISDICREFKVSEEWLRYGIGEMFLPRPAAISEILSELEDDDEKGYFSRLVETYMLLNERDRAIILNLAKYMAKEKEDRD